MTLEKLSSYYDLKLLIDVLKNELYELRAKAYKVKAVSYERYGDSSPKGTVSDKTSGYASSIAEKEHEISELYEEAEQKRAEIFDYILFTVAKEDVLTASVMYWRFIGCLEWFKVGQKTNMSDDGARKICTRYLKSHKE